MKDLPLPDILDLEGKRVLMRVDLNVSLEKDGTISDDTRIRGMIPTVRKVLDQNGTVILMSHFGRPKEKGDPECSLERIVDELSGLLGVQVRFIQDCIGEDVEKEVNAAEPGSLFLLENLRYYDEEKKGDRDFARQLAALGDVYINDAFGVVHRPHASVAVVPAFYEVGCRAFGYLMRAELAHIDKALLEPERPFAAVIGGAKVSDKIGTIMSLMKRVDHLLIGGAMAYTFIKAQGANTGGSKVETDKLEMAGQIFEKAEEFGNHLHLPVDTIIADQFSNDANIDKCPIDDIPEGWMGMDLGPDSIEAHRRILLDASTIIWNGPMGVFEMENFQKGTLAIAEATAEGTDRGAFSLVGGGDSLSAINRFGLRDRIGFVSTGGGAMLEYIEGKELPGLAAMTDQASVSSDPGQVSSKS
ncbi:MAG: phosphoglycerate kinase [Flavobacteriales bacterium]